MYNRFHVNQEELESNDKGDHAFKRSNPRGFFPIPEEHT